MKTMNSQKIFKIAIICYIAIFVIGIGFALIGGVKMDINFSGGSIITSAYKGGEDISAKDVEAVVKKITSKKFNVTENETYNSSTANKATTYTITFVGHQSLKKSEQENVQYGINRAFATTDHSYKANSYVYTYTGEVKVDALQKALNDAVKLDKDTSFTVATVKASNGTDAVSIDYSGDRWLTESEIESVDAVLAGKDYADNKFTAYNSMELYSSNSVDATLAGSFFLKSMVAVLLTAVLVILYVGLRFRRIGGVSAALTALCAVVLDVLVTFCICVIFRLEIDSNYLAVVLTILGYSLNDTIVVYDRVRENKKLNPQLSIGENMDISLGSILTRNIVTTVTTVLAVITIVVVSEIYGMTSLRTFAIPMAAGLLSGCVSSLFIAGPLWVKWRNFRDNRVEK